jgi:molybdopterin converting factor small subunit
MAERLGRDRVEWIVADGCTVESAIAEFGKESPQLRWPAGYMVALNQEYAAMTQILREGDELAIIPPVSGGMTRLKRRRIWTAR